MERLEILNNKKHVYDIVFSNSYEGLSDELKDLGFENRRICIITDSNVEKLYLATVVSELQKISSQIYKFSFVAGELSKNSKTIDSIYSFLIKNGFDRKDLIVALGGGVTGDMAAYAAATYMRGISVVQLPTSLLAMVDSSVGGKCGVDYKGFKNIIGAFKNPDLVFININVLNSLSERDYFSGFAEVMKYGLIRDEEFYEWLISNMYEIRERDEETLLYMVSKSCAYKKYYVEKDLYEKGDRAMLNYGHTIGHAIEKIKMGELMHGECVALGSVAAAYISYKKGLIKMDDYYEIRDMFVPFELPITVENIKAKDVLKAMNADKKKDGNTIRFILLKKIGKAVISTDVTKEEIVDAFNQIYFDEMAND